MLSILVVAAAHACEPLAAALPTELAGLGRAPSQCAEGLACVSYERGDTRITVSVETALPGGKDLMAERAGGPSPPERFTVGAVPAILVSNDLGSGSWGTAATAVVGRRVVTVVATGPSPDLAKVAMRSLDPARVAAAYAPCAVALDRTLDVLALLPATLDGMDRMELRNTKVVPDPPVLAVAAFAARTRPARSGVIVVQGGPVEPQFRAAVPPWPDDSVPAAQRLAVGPGAGSWFADGAASAAIVAVGDRFFVLVTIDGASAPDAAAA